MLVSNWTNRNNFAFLHCLKNGFYGCIISAPKYTKNKSASCQKDELRLMSDREVCAGTCIKSMDLIETFY